VLHDSDTVISSGEIKDITIDGEQTTAIPFDQELRMLSTSEFASRFATQEHVYADIVGEIRIDVPGLSNYGIPFKKTIDLKAYLQPPQVLEDTVESLKKGAKAQ
jgi:hypothetical protein